MDHAPPPTRHTPPDVVDTFTGPHSFLSVFHETPVLWRGRFAPTLAHHYSAARVTDPAVRAMVYDQPTPGKASRASAGHPARPGWDEHLKQDVMTSLIAAKFVPGSESARELLNTGEALLLAGNVWHDMYWGQCTCEKHYHWPGANTHGRLLMAHRASLRGITAPLTRVGITTGHRPQSLSASERKWVAAILPELMVTLRREHGMQVAISGMALGTDTVWAKAALEQHVKLWGYVPSPDQAARWNPHDQREHASLLAAASRTVLHGGSYDPRWIKASNDTIVRDCNLLVAVHKEGRTTGGTAAVIRKARACRKPLIRVNVTRREITMDGEDAWACGA